MICTLNSPKPTRPLLKKTLEPFGKSLVIPMVNKVSLFNKAASLGIALPAWLVKKENNLLVLLIYTLIFGVALPYWVASWWYQSKSLTRDKILHSTMGFFYKEVHEKIGPKGILEIISAAQEFNSIPDFNEKDIQDLALVVKKTLDERYKGTIIDKSKKYPPKSYQILLLLHSHLLRIELPQSQTLIRDSIIEKAIDLIKGVLQITVSRNWLQASTTTLELSQNMIQALYFSQSQLSQLPNLDATILKHFVTKKRNIDSISSFLELNDEECDSLLRSFTVEDIAIVKHVAKLYPVLRIVGAKFKVLGEAAVIPSSIVTFIVKLKLNEIVTEDDAIVDEDFEEEERKWWIPSQKADYVHAPYYPTEKTPYWWVFLGDQRSNRLINVTKTTFTKSTAIARIQFQAPQTSGKWNFTVFVKSDCVVGCDVSIPVELVVEKAELHPVEDYDDDISEPDLDSFAGQLQAVKKVKQEYDDSSDEDDVGGAREAPHDHSDPNHHH